MLHAIAHQASSNPATHPTSSSAQPKKMAAAPSSPITLASRSSSVDALEVSERAPEVRSAFTAGAGLRSWRAH